MPGLTLDEYENAYRAFLAAWNRKDLATALGGLAPECEFHSELSELSETGAWVGRDQIARFHAEWFELIPDWHMDDPVRVLRAGDDTFVTLDRGRGSGRGSGAPVQIDFATVVEVRDRRVVRVRQYPSWEEGLRAAGLDPSIAAVRGPAVPGGARPPSARAAPSGGRAAGAWPTAG